MSRASDFAKTITASVRISARWQQSMAAERRSQYGEAYLLRRRPTRSILRSRTCPAGEFIREGSQVTRTAWVDAAASGHRVELRSPNQLARPSRLHSMAKFAVPLGVNLEDRHYSSRLSCSVALQKLRVHVNRESEAMNAAPTPIKGTQAYYAACCASLETEYLKLPGCHSPLSDRRPAHVEAQPRCGSRVLIVPMW